MIKKFAVILSSFILLTTTAFAHGDHTAKKTKLVNSDSFMKLNNYDVKGSSINREKRALSHHDTSDYKK